MVILKCNLKLIINPFSDSLKAIILELRVKFFINSKYLYLKKYQK